MGTFFNPVNKICVDRLIAEETKRKNS